MMSITQEARSTFEIDLPGWGLDGPTRGRPQKNGSSIASPADLSAYLEHRRSGVEEKAAHALKAHRYPVAPAPALTTSKMAKNWKAAAANTNACQMAF
jgi:hypothetical protein